MDKLKALNTYIETTKREILEGKNISPHTISEKILSIWGVKEPPVPIIEILKALGFRIFEQEYKEEDRELSGFIAIDNEYRNKFGTDKIISLNTADNQGHTRFTLAHELSHYIFDFNPRVMASYSNPYITYEADKPIEKDANRFAANLLMPEKIFIKEYKKQEGICPPVFILLIEFFKFRIIFEYNLTHYFILRNIFIAPMSRIHRIVPVIT